MLITNRKSTWSVLVTVLVISFGVHVVGLVVFGAVKIAQKVFREEVTFEAPLIEPPAQDEPEYTVNLRREQETSSPPPPTAFVVDRPQDISVPALDINVNVANTSAYGRGSGGFGSGGGGGARVREMALELTSLGYTTFVAGTVEGTLFDLKKDPDGGFVVEGYEPGVHQDGAVGNQVKEPMREFAGETSISVTRFQREYYSAPNNLYASYWIFPRQQAYRAPQAFGAEGDIDPLGLFAVYQGEFTPREDGRFRFIGMADDAMLVRINKRPVLDAGNFALSDIDRESVAKQFFGFPYDARLGEWMRWTAGKPMDIEVMIGEIPGGGFGCYLLVEKEGDPKWRIFSTKELTPQEEAQLREAHEDSAQFL